MHKATFLEGTLQFTIRPDGPILIKAGESGGADPVLPDMEFVRTYRNGKRQVYLPGSSIKGVVRAHIERICRSLDSAEQQQARLAQRQRLDEQTAAPVEADRVPLADNPLGDGKRYGGLDDMTYNSGRAIEAMRSEIRERRDRTAIIYRRSSLVSQMFGHTSLAGRIRFADAYLPEPSAGAADGAPSAADTMPETDQIRIEERNGVAIDRIYGSVAVGPFNYETVVGGAFTTRIDMKNITLAQLGLLGLALRDLAQGRVGLGFGKSRGLGRVTITFDRMELYYPTCELVDTTLRLLTGRTVAAANQFAGLGALCAEEVYEGYALPRPDTAPLPAGLRFTPDDFLGVWLKAEDDAQVRALWRECMPAWKQMLGVA